MSFSNSAKQSFSLLSLFGLLLVGAAASSKIITITEELQLRQGTGSLEFIESLPVGTKVQVDEETYKSVLANPRGHQRVYIDSVGNRRLSQFAFVPNIRIVEFPESSGLDIKNYSNRNYYLPLGSLRSSENTSTVAPLDEEQLRAEARITGRSINELREKYRNDANAQTARPSETNKPTKTERTAEQRPKAEPKQEQTAESASEAPAQPEAPDEVTPETPQVRETEIQSSAPLFELEDLSETSSIDPEQVEETQESSESASEPPPLPRSKPTPPEVSNGPTEQGTYPPICACSGCRITSPMGVRCHPIIRRQFGCNDPRTQVFHDGNDWAGPTGTPVRAPCDGEVIYTGTAGGYGNQLVLHCKIKGEDYHFRFHHLHGFANSLNSNKTVKAGDVVAAVGNTGASTGPHLDIEIHVVNNPSRVVRGKGSQRRSHPNVKRLVDPTEYFSGLKSRDILQNATAGSPVRNIELYDKFNKEVLQASCPDLRHSTSTPVPTQRSQTSETTN